VANKRFNELKNLTKDELATRIRAAEAEIFQARMKLRTGQLENTSSIWLQRKDLARMKLLQAGKAAGKTKTGAGAQA